MAYRIILALIAVLLLALLSVNCGSCGGDKQGVTSEKAPPTARPAARDTEGELDPAAATRAPLPLAPATRVQPRTGSEHPAHPEPGAPQKLGNPAAGPRFKLNRPGMEERPENERFRKLPKPVMRQQPPVKRPASPSRQSAPTDEE